MPMTSFTRSPSLRQVGARRPLPRTRRPPNEARKVPEDGLTGGVGAATLLRRAPVAQLDRASVYGTEGQRFESSRARSVLPCSAQSAARPARRARFDAWPGSALVGRGHRIGGGGGCPPASPEGWGLPR